MVRAIAWVLALALLTSAALRADEKRPAVSLILLKATAEKQGEDDVWFRCQVVLDNESGDPLTVNSNFGSAFDGLEIVVTDIAGKVLLQQPYTYHQSPYSPDAGRKFTLARGKTKTELLFTVSTFGASDKPVKVRLVGMLPGSAFYRILSTDTLKVAIHDG